MEVRIELPEQDLTHGLTFGSDDGYRLSTELQADGACVVTGDAAGLRSLARHLLVLSLPGVSDGNHVHLGETTGLEPGSGGGLILQRSDTFTGRAHG